MRMDCSVTLRDRSKFTYPRGAERDYTAADLWAILSRNRFEAAVAHARLDDPAETGWLLELAAAHPWIAAVMTASTDLRQWDRWQQNPRFRGVISPSPAALLESERRRLLCSVGLVEAVEALAVVSPSRVVVRALEGLSFEEPEFEEWARRLETIPRGSALIEVGGLLNGHTGAAWHAVTYEPWIRHLLGRFGAGQLIYGSGWPDCMPAHTWKESLACFTQAMGARTVEDRAAILGNDGRRFYCDGAGVRYTEESFG